MSPRRLSSNLEANKPEGPLDYIAALRHVFTRSGGASLLRNLDRLITEEIGISCYIADNPLECVAWAPASPSTTST